MNGASAVQTSVTIHPALGLPGMEYDDGPKRVVTRIATETIPFGRYVSFAGETCELPDSSAEITGRMGGIALRDPTNPSGMYLQGDPVAVLIEGMVWVPTEEAIVTGDAVYVRHTASGGNTDQGKFRNDADTASCAIPAGTAWFKGGTDLAVLRLAGP